jgi:hypothetical protein
MRGLGQWCLTLLSTLFELYCGAHFYWWRKPENPEKTTDLPQVLSIISHDEMGRRGRARVVW